MTPAEAGDLPAIVRAALEAACDGDWRRVVADGAGGYVVRNHPVASPQAAKAAPRARRPRRAAAPATAPVPDVAPPPRVLRCGRCSTEGHGAEDCKVSLRPRKKAETPAERREKLRTVALEDLASAFNAPAARTENSAGELTSIRWGNARRTEGGVTVVRAERDRGYLYDRQEYVPADPSAPGFDWTKVSDGVVGSAHSLCARFSGGYAHGFTWLPDVLALEGLDLGIVEDAMRHPERVEVRPESKGKGYPILGFHRGDVLTVLGFKDPEKPCVIAAYVSSRLEHDIHRVNHHGGGAGGKAEKGLPRTPTQLKTRLKALGCEVTPDADHKTAEVTYKGHSLGKVSIGPTAVRTQCEVDYQRCMRRIQGVDR